MDDINDVITQAKKQVNKHTGIDLKCIHIIGISHKSIQYEVYTNCKIDKKLGIKPYKVGKINLEKEIKKY